MTNDIKVNKNFHFLSKNERTITPVHIICFDTETKIENGKQVLKMGWVFYCKRENGKITREKKYFFTTPNEFWNILKNYCYRNTKVFVFAHNTQFDFMIVGGSIELLKHNFYIDNHFLDNSNFIMSIKEKNKIDSKKHYTGTNFIFLDTMNYVKRSLRDIGKMINLYKLEIDFKTCSDDELKNYCYRDVEITQKFILDWIEFLSENDLGNFQYTLASQSFSSFRHRFMKHNIGIHNIVNAIELERKSYRGGRNEVFKFGKDYAYIYDVNSMYPFVMSNFKYPTKIIAFYPKGNIGSIERAIKKDFGIIADVDISTTENVIGIKRDRLIFPVGSFRCQITTPEIKYLLENGHKILKVHNYSIYEMDYIFSDFVDFFYNERLKAKEQNNEIKSYMYKILLNSLYGKFGQKINNWLEIGNYDNENERIEQIYKPDIKEYQIFKYYGGKIYKNDGYIEGYNSFVAIPSFVTSYARIYLYELMKVAKKENVIYCDTDSLFLTIDGHNNIKETEFVDDKKLGCLKLEKKGNVNIFGCKDYNFNKVRKTKGISKNSRVIDKNTFEQQQFIKIRTALRKNLLDGIYVNTIVKKLNQDYKKSLVVDNKSIPFELHL